MQHEYRLDIEKNARQLDIPWLIIHGDNDEAVAIKEAQSLHHWGKYSTLNIIQNTGHTFDAKEPWDDTLMPKALATAVDLCIAFVVKNSKGM